MNNRRTSPTNRYSSLLGTILLMATGNLFAAVTDLATQPLAESSTATIAPNIMFILDDSGSMDWDYMPDYVNDNSPGFCRDNYSEDSNMDGNPDRCYAGDPPYYANAFNGVYYNPTITYSPPLNADGTSKTSYNTAALWAAVKNDGYNVQSTSTKNLLTSYPERKWCSSSGCGGTCKNATDAGGNYIYPDATYKHSCTVNSTPLYYVTTVEWCDGITAGVGSGTCQSKKTSTYKYVKYGTFARTNIVSTTTSYPKAVTRTDCAGTTCTYNEEMTNFANWYAYYHTRMQMMKTSVSHAFNSLTNNYRVGYMSINNNTSSDFLNITNFDATQKSSWYTKLFAANPNNSTPLRSALSTAGLIYSKQLTTLNGSTVNDPIQYSCQQNFAILSTDGYWNTGNDSGCSGRNGAGCTTAKNVGVGNQDGSASKPLYDGSNAVTITTTVSTTESRTSTTCSGGRPNKIKVDTVTTTRTVTTKPDGTLVSDVTVGPTTNTNTLGCTSSNRALQSPNPNVTTTTNSTTAGGSTDSLSDVAAYYYNTDLRPSGSMGALGTDVSENNVPAIGSNSIVDDMATHQHMTTFTLGLGLDGTLTYLDGYKTSTSGDYFNIKQGSLNWPVPSADNPTAIDDLWHAAVDGHGTYFSAKNPDSLSDGLNKALSAISISVGSGAAAATSNLEPVAGDNYVYVASYRTLQWDGDIGAYTIDLSSGTVATSPSWLAGSLLNSKIDSAGDSDARTIYTYDSSGTTHLKSFTWANLTATEQAYFNTNQLSQYADWPAAEKAAATGASLVNYLRGHNHDEDQDREPTYGTYYRLYRDRDNVLGDIIHAQPTYTQKPGFNYTDAGYAAYKSAQASRLGTLYVATNDGMLHAIDSSSGEERWAYIPQIVLPNLYKLADKGYGNNHQYYADGAPTIGDICPSAPGTPCTGTEWKTILVAGLNKGGRGYYALDITDPSNPKALWNFTSSNDGDLGYSFGKPLITKLGDGTWVVMVTSGYNNVPNDPASVTTGDGKGYLYVLNASTGALISKIGTTEGSTSSPSGLAQINNWVDSLDLDNTTLRVYGGDLYGNLWRFNADTGTAHKVAAFGSTQPITVRPELGEIDSKAVVLLGTGRYLGQSDLVDTSTQSIYAIKDPLDATTLTNPQSVLVQQTLTTTGLERTTSNNPVDWNTKMGWYINLPDPGERVNIDPLLQLGTLSIASNTPTAGACSPGGYSWLYNLNYRTGSFVSSATGNVAANKLSYITVGLNVVKLPDGTVIIYRTGHKNPVPETREMPVGGGAVEAKRVTWRELVN